MKYNFFTYFNKDYLVTGITLYRSLKALNIDFILVVCALDNVVSEAVNALKQEGESLEVIELEEVERFDPEFAACRDNRSFVEYLFTLSPVLPRYIFAKYQFDVINYLDADLFFFSSPEPLHAEFELHNGAVSIMEHGFTPKLEWRMMYGRFNVEFQIYRRTTSGEALEWWRKMCIQWCYDRVEEKRFADQKYLDEFPVKFKNIVISRIHRAGIAPWNWPLRPINEPLFFHFQGFRFLSKHFVCTNLGSYGNSMSGYLKNKYYQRYATEMKMSFKFLNSRFPHLQINLFSGGSRLSSGRFRRLVSAIIHRNLMFIK